MKLICLTFLMYAFPSFAGWAQKVKDHLPEKVQRLELGKTPRDSARKILGKPALVKGDKEYWIIDGFKYALELTFKDNKLETLHFNFPKRTLAFETLKDFIDPGLLKTSPSQPHTSLTYEDKEGRMEVDVSTGKVESVRLR